jgi:hypothetical protein
MDRTHVPTGGALLSALALSLTLVLLPSKHARGRQFEVGGIVLTPGPNDSVSVQHKDWAWQSGPKRNPATTFTFDSGRAVYAIRFNHEYGNGTLGICEPTRCNWYESGMLDIVLDGKRVSFTNDDSLTVRTDEGSRGLLQLTWERPEARVAVMFVMPAGANYIFCELRIDPQKIPESLIVRLKNYPAGFSKKPEHVVVTPGRWIVETGDQPLNPERDWALLYLDNTLDRDENGDGAGPCAVAWENGKWCESATVRLAGYGTTTQLKCRPETARIRFCFVEYPDKTDAEALKAFNDALPEIREAFGDDDLFTVQTNMQENDR